MSLNDVKEKKWYKLDAFAKTYSSIISEGRTTCFRLSVLICSEIDENILKKVIQKLEKKYPFYNSELKKGIFWNYLQHKKTSFFVGVENTYPCTDIKKRNPLRIIYYKNKLSVEIAHFLTDGVGATIFFKDLIKEYLEELYFNSSENIGNKSIFNSVKEDTKEFLEDVEKDEYVVLYSKYM